METIKIGTVIILLIYMFSSSANAASKKTTTIEFKVEGVCGQCEKRIENAALIKGVKLAEWNKKTKMLKVVFVTRKTNKETIQKSIAEAGHDSEKFKAPDAKYKSLPACCAYRDGVATH